MRFQVLATLLSKIQVFWDVTLCHGVSSLGCFKESLYLQAKHPFFLYFLTWKHHKGPAA